MSEDVPTRYPRFYDCPSCGFYHRAGQTFARGEAFVKASMRDLDKEYGVLGWTETEPEKGCEQ